MAARSPADVDLRPEDERTALLQRLDQYRAIAAAALLDVPWPRASARLLPAPDLTIAGIVKHLAWAEDRWFQGRLLGVEMPAPWNRVGADDPDSSMRLTPGDTVEGILELYSSACDRSRHAVARFDALTQVAAVPSFGTGPVNLRWILVHMIDETARHAGHLDLLCDTLPSEGTNPLQRMSDLMAVGRGGDRAAARVGLHQLWVECVDASAAVRCGIAHALADVHDDPVDELAWDQQALVAALAATDEEVAATGMEQGVAALLPSLHLNLADVYRRLGQLDAAAGHAHAAQAALSNVSIDGYFDEIERAVTRVLERIEGSADPTS